MYNFVRTYLHEIDEIFQRLEIDAIERVVDELVSLRKRQGRLFLLGSGGSAANAAHAVADFRKFTHIPAYSPSDNIAYLTAITNDNGWEWAYHDWLMSSKLSADDAILVLSVGGGSLEKNVSPNLVRAIDLGIFIGCTILGITGRDGGYTAKVAKECLIIPTSNPDHITVHSEAMQSIFWHLFVSHPKLNITTPTWEQHGLQVEPATNS